MSITERPVESELKALLVNNEPFQYAHLIKFERPSRPDSVTGKVSTNRVRYTYLTDASRNVTFDDGSVDLEGVANGPQVYLANKLLSVGAINEQTKAATSTTSIVLDGNAIGARIEDTYTIALVSSGVWDISSSFVSTDDYLAQGFREGDKITLSYTVASAQYTHTVNIKSFRANGVLRVTKIDDTLVTGTSIPTVITLSSEEIISVLLDKNADSYSSFINREVYIYRAYFKEGAIVGSPILLFKGIIYNVNFQDNETDIKVTWGLTSHWGDFAQVRGRITSDTFHRALDQNGVPQPGSALKPAYAYDRGFIHSESSINMLSTYSVLVEKQDVKYKKGFLGIGSGVKVRKYFVNEDRNTKLDFQLQAKSIPIIYGTRVVPGIPIFADTLNNDSANVYVVYVLSEGEIGGIYDIYIENNSLICNDKADADARSGQTADNSVEYICIGRADRGDALGGEIATSETSFNFYDEEGERSSLYNERGRDQNLNIKYLMQQYGVGIQPTYSSYGVLDGESIRLTNPQEITLDFFSGKPDQEAAASLSNIAHQKGFKIQNNYWIGEGTGDYWGPNHRLLDTAYIVGNFIIAEGETTIPEIQYVVRGKLLECYNYDYSYDRYSRSDAEFKADIINVSGNTATLQVTRMIKGTLAVGKALSGGYLPADTTITALGTGTGGEGTYTITSSSSAISLPASNVIITTVPVSADKFPLGSYVTLHYRNASNQEIALNGGRSLQIIDKWTFKNTDGTDNTRFRFSENPDLGYIDGVPTITKFYMKNASNNTWEMVTYNFKEASGTGITPIYSTITGTSQTGSSTSIQTIRLGTYDIPVSLEEDGSWSIFVVTSDEVTSSLVGSKLIAQGFGNTAYNGKEFEVLLAETYEYEYLGAKGAIKLALPSNLGPIGGASSTYGTLGGNPLLSLSYSSNADMTVINGNANQFKVLTSSFETVNNASTFKDNILSGTATSTSLSTPFPYSNTSAEASSLVGNRLVSMNTFKLPSSFPSVDGEYTGTTLVITRVDAEGKSKSQEVIVAGYNGSTKIITIKGTLEFIPDSTDSFYIKGGASDRRVSINPAIQTLDYITSTTYGRGLDINKDLDLPSWLEAARYCDTRSDITVELLSTSGVQVNDVYKYPATGNIVWQGKVKSIDGNFVTFTDNIGKLTNKWMSWKAYKAGEVVYNTDGGIFKVTNNSTIPTKPFVGGTGYTAFGTTGNMSFDLTKVSNNTTVSLRMYADADVSTPGKYYNPIRSLKNGQPISGYSIYDADDIDYWRLSGWDDHAQRFVTKHQTNLILDTSVPLFENINGLLDHYGGILRYTAGKYSLDVEKQEPPAPAGDIRNITSDDIIGRIQLTDEGVRSAYNSLVAAFADPANKFEARNISFFNSEYLKADRNVPKKGNVSVPGITNYYNTRLLADSYLNKSRFGLTINMTVRYHGILLLAGTVIEVTYPRYDWNNKPFRIESVNYQPDGLVDIVAKEYDDSFYSLEKLGRADSTGATSIKTARIVSVGSPTNLRVTSADTENELLNGVELFWDNHPNATSVNVVTEIYASRSSNLFLNINTIGSGGVLTTSQSNHFLLPGMPIYWVDTYRNELLADNIYYVRETFSNNPALGLNQFTLSTTKKTGVSAPEELPPLLTLTPATGLNLSCRTGILLATVPVPGNSYVDSVVNEDTGRVEKYYWIRHKVTQ